MQHIVKSYLKTFFQKNYVSTFGILLFIITLATVIIGMLATPLQLNSKINYLSKNNTSYNSLLDTKSMNYSPEFSYNFFYLNKEINNKDTTNVKLSDLYIKAINSQLENNFDTSSDKKDNNLYVYDINKADDKIKINFISNLINNDLFIYRNGALIKTESYILNKNYQDNNQNSFLNISKQILKRIIADFHQSMTDGFYLDDKSKYDYVISEFYKAYSRFNSFLTINEINLIDKPILALKFTDILSKFNNNKIDEILNFLKKQLDDLKNQIKDYKKKKTYLPSFLVFSKEFTKELANEKFLYDDRIYIVDQLLNNTNDFLLQTKKSFKIQQSSVGQLLPFLTLQLTSDNQVFKNTNKDFNQIQFDKNYKNSKLADKWNPNINYQKKVNPTEIVISSSYAKARNLKINDEFIIPSSNISDIYLNLINKKDAYYLNSINSKIVGIGSTFDDIVSKNSATDYFQNKTSYVVGYISKEFINSIRNSRWNFANKIDTSYQVNFRIKNLNNASTSQLNEHFIIKFDNNSTQSFSIFDKTNSLVTEWYSLRTSQAISTIKVQVIIYIVIGVFVLLLSFIFINFALKKEMNETRRQIGIFKSFGYKVVELSWIFAFKTWLTIFFGLIIGYILSIPIQIYSSSNFVNSVTFTFNNIYISPLLLVFLIVIIPLAFLMGSYFASIIYIKEPVLSLINNSKKTKRTKSGAFTNLLSKHNIGFNYRMRLSFIKNAKGKFAAVQILFGFASLTYTLLFVAQAILFQSINQSLSIIKDDVITKSVWNVNKKIDNTSKNDKLGYVNSNDPNTRQTLTYYDLNKKNINSYLNSDSKQTDSRYRIELFLNILNNSFNSLSDEKKVSMILPLEYAKKTLTPFLQPGKTETNDYEVLTKENDYYLSYISKFNLYNENPKWTTALNNFKNNKKIKLTIKDLLNDNKHSNKTFYDLNSANSDQLENTIIGLQANRNNLNNSIFLSSFAKIFSYKLAQAYSLYQIFINYKESKNDIQKAWNLLTKDNDLLKFNPSDQKYWTIANNPLLEKIINNSFKNNKNKKDPKNALESNPNFSIDSLLNSTNLSNASQGILLASMIMQNLDNKFEKNPIVSFNQMFYDSSKDLLSAVVLASNSDVLNPGSYSLALYRLKDHKFGDVNQFLNFKGVSLKAFQDLTKLPKRHKNLPTFNVIVPYYYAQANNLVIDSKIIVETKSTFVKKFALNVVGINKSETLSISKIPNLFLDYDLFASEMFSQDLYKNNNPLIFNQLWSKNKILEGTINFSKLDDSFKTIKYYGNNLAIDINKTAPIFLSMYSTIFTEFNNFISKYKTLDLANDIYNTPNPAIQNLSRLNSKLFNFNLVKQTIDKITKITNQVMLLFILLVSLLLTIILVVVMNIVVDEAKKTILTLRAIGYENSEVNWVVMGSYIIGAIISFIIAYLLSNLIWWSFLYYVSYKWHIYIFLAFDFKTLFVTFIVIALVLFIGWVFSDEQVKKTPLTQIAQAE
ncbi:ABC transporter permease [Mycoplasma capricolum subsp. capripneumoniae]|uniref:ABC transporter permease n=1 Tax=Mycoplasma capricolum TaxID=2095 RepID=UPI0014050326|nr:ABC transporter permease [Mycoplasma capricolum]QIN43046.1 ABC transporter permease [Mycoplasma capricolum subsp. capripneumoniae]QIN43728.1 ABC transporter permease [Mycoplasma capricolum subsp. capripneumoniae]QIN44415.1 ABC transporter permease [Mycoplasma capricolum subsp. capripneumoniae]QIN50604.1 ABC transporter permease [Mycoplasma capricolum subsp. capripneumoniae]